MTENTYWTETRKIFTEIDYDTFKLWKSVQSVPIYAFYQFEEYYGQDVAQLIFRLKDKIDIEYLKTEVENLVSGIRDGAERTVEIVKGLRTFSRLDEGEIKTVNIYEGLDSTIVLLRNMLNENIII
jgi:signal transduction histidine kinase